MICITCMVVWPLTTVQVSLKNVRLKVQIEIVNHSKFESNWIFPSNTKDITFPLQSFLIPSRIFPALIPITSYFPCTPISIIFYLIIKSFTIFLLSKTKIFMSKYFDMCYLDAWFVRQLQGFWSHDLHWRLLASSLTPQTVPRRLPVGKYSPCPTNVAFGVEMIRSMAFQKQSSTSTPQMARSKDWLDLIIRWNCLCCYGCGFQRSTSSRKRKCTNLISYDRSSVLKKRK